MILLTTPMPQRAGTQSQPCPPRTAQGRAHPCGHADGWSARGMMSDDAGQTPHFHCRLSTFGSPPTPDMSLHGANRRDGPEAEVGKRTKRSRKGRTIGVTVSELVRHFARPPLVRSIYQVLISGFRARPAGFPRCARPGAAAPCHIVRESWRAGSDCRGF
jgi:hypothetical protein